MPELPEVETTCRGISPFLTDQIIADIHVYQPNLRQPVPDTLQQVSKNQKIHQVFRRAKYIILKLDRGSILIHLGMTGHLRVLPHFCDQQKHDHIDAILSNGHVLRYHDPRRFGSWQWLDPSDLNHPSLCHLGVEPLSPEFNGQFLLSACQSKKQPIKSAIMDNRIVVGIGNIYATESLFLSKIHPMTPAGQVTYNQFNKLANEIKHVLTKAITAGGTTLKDFISPQGKPGYFSQSLYVYGRKNQLCFVCKEAIESLTIAGRTTAYCPGCQPINEQIG